MVTSTSKPGSARHTDGTPDSITIQNCFGSSVNRMCRTWRLPGKPDSVEPGVHPPHQQLGVELVGVGVAERPLRAPLAQAEHDRFELAAGVGEQVLVAEPLDEPGPLELAQPLGQQAARQPGQPAGQVVEPRRADQHVAQDQQRPSLAQHVEGP